VRGGIVLIDNTTGAVQRIVPLQYNPDTLSRSFQIKGVSGESGDHLEALRLKGPPVETIKLEAEIDATDALEAGDPLVAQVGLHARLAALETIIYPTSGHLFATNRQAAAGTIEIAPEQGPLTLFIFGQQRIVPVRITELSITEESFDVGLNPLRAKLSLGLRVLTIDDLGFEAKGGGLFMTYLQAKERLAGSGASVGLSALGLTGLP
jgi:hypothetical protein